MKLNNSIFSGSFIGNTLISLSSSIVARALSLMAMALTTHYFDPNDYGIWVLVLSFATFFGPVSNLRLDVPLVMTQQPKTLRGLLQIIFAMTSACIVFIFILAIFLKYEKMTSLLGLPEAHSELLLVAPIVLLLNALQMAGNGLLLRQRNFKVIALASLTIPSLAIALICFFALINLVSADAAALVFIGSQIGGLAVSLYPVRHQLFDAFSDATDLTNAREALRIYAVYPKLTLPFSLSVIVAERVIQITLVKYYALGLLASFFLARQITSGITSVVAGALRGSFFAHSADKKDEGELNDRILILIKYTTYLSCPALAFGFFWIEEVIRLFTGNRWEYLAIFSPLCLVPAFFMVITGPLERVFDLAGRQSLSVALQVISDLATVLVVVGGAMLGWSVYYVIAALCAMMTIYNIVWLASALLITNIPRPTTVTVFQRLFGLLFLSVMAQYLARLIPNFWLSFIFANIIFLLGSLPLLIVLRSVITFPKDHWSEKIFAQLARLP